MRLPKVHYVWSLPDGAEGRCDTWSEAKAELERHYKGPFASLSWRKSSNGDVDYYLPTERKMIEDATVEHPLAVIVRIEEVEA